jgi:hypothetical protein
LWVAQETSSTSPGRIVIFAFIVIAKALSCYRGAMPDMFANLLDDLIQLFIIQARITPREGNHCVVIQNHQ